MEYMVATVYISSRCPNCQRLLEQLQWLRETNLKLSVNIVNVDEKRVDGLTAVPTVVDKKDVHVGTRAFEWLQTFDSQVPLNAYAADAEGDTELPSTLF